MNKSQAGCGLLHRETAHGDLSELQAEVLRVLQAAGREPLRARQVLDRLPGRGPASRRAVAAALQHLHAAGLASCESGTDGVWVYQSTGRAWPGAACSLGSLLGLGPLETEIMQVAWDADSGLTVTEFLTELDYPATRYNTIATVAGILCGKNLLTRARREPGLTPGSCGRRSWVYRPVQCFSEYAGERIAALLDHSPYPAAVLAHALATTPAGPRAGILIQAPSRR